MMLFSFIDILGHIQSLYKTTLAKLHQAACETLVCVHALQSFKRQYSMQIQYNVNTIFLSQLLCHELYGGGDEKQEIQLLWPNNIP